MVVGMPRGQLPLYTIKCVTYTFYSKLKHDSITESYFNCPFVYMYSQMFRSTVNCIKISTFFNVSRCTFENLSHSKVIIQISTKDRAYSEISRRALLMDGSRTLALHNQVCSHLHYTIILHVGVQLMLSLRYCTVSDQMSKQCSYVS